MASITFSGQLDQAMNELAAEGNKVLFVPHQTVGEVLPGAASELVVDSDGSYSITLAYNTYSIYHYSDVTKRKTLIATDVVVSADTLVSTIPDLIGSTIPVTEDSVLTIQGYLTDAKSAASSAANSEANATAAADSISDLAMSSGIYPDTASGISETSDGDYFTIVSPDELGYLDLYLNDGGSAVYQKTYPNSQVVIENSDDIELLDLINDSKAFNDNYGVTSNQSQAIAVTNDGYKLIGTDDGDVVINETTKFEADFGFKDVYQVETDDGYPLLSIDDSAILKSAFGELDPNLFTPFEVQTKDGYSIVKAVNDTSALQFIRDGKQLNFNTSDDSVVGDFCTGSHSAITSWGDYFQYQIDGKYGSGRVIGKSQGDWLSPHMLDSNTMQVFESDGQSWQTIDDYSPDEIDYEETTGATSNTIRKLLSPSVNIFRKSNWVDVASEDDSISPILPTISNGSYPGEFARLTPRVNYSISKMSALAFNGQCKRLGSNFGNIAVLNVGWPGTSSEKFLPEGVSYDYTDDDGVEQTITAAEHPTAGHYLWADNIIRRQAIADFVKDRYSSISLSYKYLTWIQGPFSDYGAAYGFMTTYREQQDLLELPDVGAINRYILWDQNGGTTRMTESNLGYQAAVDFCQENESGYDFLVGPRYPHKLRDYIHHSSLGALEYAERTGQAAAYVETYGNWEPLWVIDVSFDGSVVTITTNTPVQADGQLVIDTETVRENGNYGFSLWDVDSDAEISISNVTITSGNTIELTTSSTLSGSIEVGYCARKYITTDDGTVSSPQLSSLAGNIKMTGVDEPAIIPKSIVPKLDQWLCIHRKTYEV